MKTFFVIFVVAILMATSCSEPPKRIDLPYSAADFSSVIDGKETALYMLSNSNGMVVTLTNYGAKIVSIFVPGRDGSMADVMLGFSSIADYMQYGASHGATVGPFANRIGGASFTIDGTTYQLEANNNGNTLHGGSSTFSREVWTATQSGNSVAMTLESPDGAYGFPGNKIITVLFTLTEANELHIDYSAESDAPTHINLTNHGYFNLRGEGDGNILDHIVVINADYVTEVDAYMIPTGDIVGVADSPLDFRMPVSVGKRIDEDHPQIRIASGYDFNYVLNKEPGELSFAGSAYEPESGRYMEVFTTEPGMQFFTANHFQGSEVGKSGRPFLHRGGFCFETQHFPDSPNKPHFPSTLLVPGEPYQSTTIFKFSVITASSETAN